MDRLFQPRTPVLACFTFLILYHRELTRATIQMGWKRRKCTDTDRRGLGASAGARLDAPTRWP
eukprot:5586133-Pleurochrysis_carterae.AAC.1